MRRGCAIALLILAGCRTYTGGVNSTPPGRADDPRYDIAEQQRRGRERLSIIEDDLAPRAYVDRPGVTGR